MKKNPAAYEPGADFAWHYPKQRMPDDGVEYWLIVHGLEQSRRRGFYRAAERSFANRRGITYAIDGVAAYRRL